MTIQMRSMCGNFKENKNIAYISTLLTKCLCIYKESEVSVYNLHVIISVTFVNCREEKQKLEK